MQVMKLNKPSRRVYFADEKGLELATIHEIEKVPEIHLPYHVRYKVMEETDENCSCTCSIF